MGQTSLQLPPLNHRTIQQWHDNRDKKDIQATLVQGMDLPTMALTASEPLQPIKERPAELPKVTGMPAHTYSMPPDALGFAKLRDTPVPIAPFNPRPAPPPTLQPAATLGTSQVFVLSTETLAQGIRLPEPVALKPQTVPRTTAWRQKKRMEQGLELKRKRTTPANLCSKCKKTKNKDTDHRGSRKRGYIYCPSSGQTYEEWEANLHNSGASRLQLTLSG